MTIEANDIGAVFTMSAVFTALMSGLVIAFRCWYVRSHGGAEYFRGWMDATDAMCRKLGALEPPEKYKSYAGQHQEGQ